MVIARIVALKNPSMLKFRKQGSHLLKQTSSQANRVAMQDVPPQTGNKKLKDLRRMDGSKAGSSSA